MVDIEGLDCDIVVEYISKFNKPKVICFEAWEEYALSDVTLDVIKRNDILTFLKNNNYKLIKFEDDFCAILK